MQTPAHKAQSFQHRASELMIWAAHTDNPALKHKLTAAAHLRAAEEEVLGVPLDLSCREITFGHSNGRGPWATPGRAA